MSFCKVENLIIRAFQGAWLAHKTSKLDYQLLNAPLSGKTNKQSHHLLTFSTLNGFHRLAIWGMAHGADIWARDGNQLTMLDMAYLYRQPYMVDFVLGSQAETPGHPTGKTARIYTDMLQEMDRHLLYAIRKHKLSPDDINSFEVHGRSFDLFLALNGFDQSLRYRLHYVLTPEQAKKQIHQRDVYGFDMLLAAVYSGNVNAVREVLKVSRYSINERVPRRRGYENPGMNPLSLAYHWNTAPEVIQLLIDKGATPPL